MTDEPKRRGRPRLPIEQKKRRGFTFRVRNAMHAKLNAAATENGRSVSEEIEARIERSFDREDWCAELLAELRKTAAPRVEWSGEHQPVTYYIGTSEGMLD